MARNLFVDFILSMLFVLALALGFFGVLSYALAVVFLFALLFVALLDTTKTVPAEEPSRKYVEMEKKREARTRRRQLIDLLVQRIDFMIEKVKYLRALLKGEVLVLE